MLEPPEFVPIMVNIVLDIRTVDLPEIAPETGLKNNPSGRFGVIEYPYAVLPLTAIVTNSPV